MPMLDLVYLRKLQDKLHTYQNMRRQVNIETDNILYNAKRAIFAMQRGQMSEAKNILSRLESQLISMQKKYCHEAKIETEGCYRAALEEYVEATLLYQFLATGQIGQIMKVKVEVEVYLAGLCDVLGELYRLAIQAGRHRDMVTIERCRGIGSVIIGELIAFNLTSYLRTKFDQAKQAMQKLEIVSYEVALRLDSEVNS